jgi:hypothetical protein
MMILTEFGLFPSSQSTVTEKDAQRYHNECLCVYRTICDSLHTFLFKAINQINNMADFLHGDSGANG